MRKEFVLIVHFTLYILYQSYVVLKPFLLITVCIYHVLSKTMFSEQNCEKFKQKVAGNISSSFSHYYFYFYFFLVL